MIDTTALAAMQLQLQGKAISPAQKLLLQFDDDQGVFYQPGGEGSRARLDWQIDLALLNGSDMKNQDNGGDWIIDLHPKKLHG